MSEYADFMEESLRESNPEYVARQKALEERIRKPFRIIAGERVIPNRLFSVSSPKAASASEEALGTK